MRIASMNCLVSYLAVFLLTYLGYVTDAVAAQPTRFRITNHCTETIWIQQDWNRHTSDQIVEKITAGASHDYQIPDIGLASTRFWPKMGCNQSGYNCRMGESTGVPDAERAGYQRGPYSPDINSKFEATWGCLPAIHDNNPQACVINPSAPANDPAQRIGSETWWNGSAVDGYTLPYRINVINHHNSCEDPMHPGKMLENPSVDCAGLDVALCPTNENLSPSATQTQINGVAVDHVNLQWHDSTGHPIGCFSPCSKLTMAQGGENGSTLGGWKNILGGLIPQSPEAQLYCCPTPPVSPETCSAGPAAKSAYSISVHEAQKCSAYTYAYDDAKGLAKCAGDTQFEVIFCPTPADTTSENNTTPTETLANMKMIIPDTVNILLANQQVTNGQTVAIKTNSVLSLQGQQDKTCLLSVDTNKNVAIQNGTLCGSINIDNATKTITVAQIQPTPPAAGFPFQVNLNPAFNIKAYLNDKPTENAQVWQSTDFPTQTVLKANQGSKWGSCPLTLTANHIQKGSGKLCTRLNIVKESSGKVHVYLPADIPNTDTNPTPPPAPLPTPPKYVVFGMDASIWANFKDLVVTNGTKVALDTLGSNSQLSLIAHQGQLSAHCIIGKSGETLSIVQDSGLLCKGGLVLITQQNGDYYVGLPNPLPQPTGDQKAFGLGIAQGMSVTVNGQTVRWDSPDKTVILSAGQTMLSILGNNRITRLCPVTLNQGTLSWPHSSDCVGVVVNGNILYFPAF